MDERVAYEMHAGDYHEVEIPVTIDGVEADLDGMEYIYVWAKEPGLDPVLTKTGTVSGGKLVVILDPPDTKTVVPGDYYHECKIRNPEDKLPITAEFISQTTQEKRIRVTLLASSAEFTD
jgi:hypothetical protein